MLESWIGLDPSVTRISHSTSCNPMPRHGQIWQSELSATRKGGTIMGTGKMQCKSLQMFYAQTSSPSPITGRLYMAGHVQFCFTPSCSCTSDLCTMCSCTSEEYAASGGGLVGSLLRVSELLFYYSFTLPPLPPCGSSYLLGLSQRHRFKAHNSGRKGGGRG